MSCGSGEAGGGVEREVDDELCIIDASGARLFRLGAGIGVSK